MKISAIIHALETVAPSSIQEGWDNSGLQIGLPEGNEEVSGVLICLDLSEDIVAEAVSKGCNMIVTHHPLIFKPFKNIIGHTPQQRSAMAAIRAGVAVYSAHTSLDSAPEGISYEMARMLGLEVRGVLHPSAEGAYRTLTFVCESTDASDLRLSLHDAGVEHCDEVSATGSELLAGGPESLPGEYEEHCPALARVSAQVEQYRAGAVVKAVSGTEAARSPWFAYSIGAGQTGRRSRCGLGVIGDFAEGMRCDEFIELLHKTFHTQCVKVSSAYSAELPIKRVALCGGSAPEFASAAFGLGADVYVCGDIRYHDFSEASQNGRIIADIGHFESELCAKSIFYRIITNNFPNFAVYYSETEENPVKYL